MAHEQEGGVLERVDGAWMIGRRGGVEKFFRVCEKIKIGSTEEKGSTQDRSENERCNFDEWREATAQHSTGQQQWPAT